MDVWSKTDAKLTRNLVHSIKSRIFQLIQRNENVIDYKRCITLCIFFVFLRSRYIFDTLQTHVFHIFVYFELNISDIIQVNCFYLRVLDIQFKKVNANLKDLISRSRNKISKVGIIMTRTVSEISVLLFVILYKLLFTYSIPNHHVIKMQLKSRKD